MGWGGGKAGLEKESVTSTTDYPASTQGGIKGSIFTIYFNKIQ